MGTYLYHKLNKLTCDTGYEISQGGNRLRNFQRNMYACLGQSLFVILSHSKIMHKKKQAAASAATCTLYCLKPGKIYQISTVPTDLLPPDTVS